MGIEAIAIATTLVSTGVSFMQQSAQADAQRAAQERRNEALFDSTIEGYKKLDKEEKKVLEQSHIDSLAAQKEFLIERSKIENQASASGTYGRSVDLMIADLQTGKAQEDADIVYRRDAQFDDASDSPATPDAGGSIKRNASRKFVWWCRASSTSLVFTRPSRL